jgi:lysylphosphatidylglycerol synthetase-like protein (DUF2156 family)
MNTQYEKIRRQIVSGILLITSVATILSTLGIINLNFIHRVQFISNDFLFVSHHFEIFILLVLIISAYNLGRGKKTAWVISLILLGILLSLHLTHKLPVIALIIPTMLILYLIVFRHDYRRKGRFEDDFSKIRITNNIFIFFLVVSLTFLAFYVTKTDFSPHLNNETALLSTLYSAGLLDTTIDYFPVTKKAEIVVNTSTIFFITVYSYFSYLLIVYLWQAKKPHGSDSSIEKILMQYGNKSTACFVMMRDKSYFLEKEMNSFVSYRIINGVGLTLGEPIGSDESLDELISKFSTFCLDNDLVPAFYQISNPVLFETQKFKTFKIGEEAIIYPNLFSLNGMRMKNLRNSVAHAERSKILVHIFTKNTTLNAQIIDDIAKISRLWLEGGKREVGFSCTTLVKETFESDFDLLILGMFGDEACAFLTLKQYPAGNGFVLDLLRRIPDSPNGILELMIYRAIHFVAESFPEIDEISLGLAGLSDSLKQINRDSGVIESALFSIGKSLDMFYRYDSLFIFKDKFNPDWKSRYVAIPDLLSLPRVISSVYRAHVSHI